MNHYSSWCTEYIAELCHGTLHLQAEVKNLRKHYYNKNTLPENSVKGK